MMVVEQVIPALDGFQKSRGMAQNLMSVIDEKGTQFQFRLVKNLAGGASARIYKSYSRDMNALKPIAIKRIEAAAFKGYEDEFVQLINRERLALQELSKFKNHVTEYYGYYYYAPKDEHWLAMEYCDGASVYYLSKHILTDLNIAKNFPRLGRFNSTFKTFNNMRKRTMSKIRGWDAAAIQAVQEEESLDPKTVNLKQVAAIAAGALRGLEVIHNAGFIHGDIKSGNILLCYPGIVKICDFGLTSKVVGVANPDFHALGTLDYMAPEQMLKSLALDHNNPHPERYKYNHKIDIWALGIIVLELLLGRTPLSELRRIDEEEFSFYIANMCKPQRVENMGSGLGYLFYLPAYHENFMRHNWQIRDRDLLCKRLPLLKANRKMLLEMLMRPNQYNKRPNPNLEVPKPRVPKLFSLNKCLDFVGQCLFIRYRMRPDASQMQKHPFVRAACRELKRIEPKMEMIAKLQKKWGERKGLWRKFPTSLTIHEIFKMLDTEKAAQKETILNVTF